MPAKKTASKQRKKAPASGKKATRKVASRKTASTKRTATRKKTTSATRNKAAPLKKTSRKKAASKKSPGTKKTGASKPSGSRKAAAKPVSRKKTTAKKSTSRKAVTKKVSSKKSVSGSRSTSTQRPPAKKTPARRSRASLLSGPIHGIEPYKPKRGEDYMSPEQLEHFRKILTSWKRELMYEVDRTVHHMQDEAANFPDPNDRATQESEFGLELRTRDRERKLLRKIDSALARINEGTYGYCDETGEEIGLKRLEARPVATLCLEAQERRELAERQFRDRDDRYR